MSTATSGQNQTVSARLLPADPRALAGGSRLCPPVPGRLRCWAGRSGAPPGPLPSAPRRGDEGGRGPLWLVVPPLWPVQRLPAPVFWLPSQALIGGGGALNPGVVWGAGLTPIFCLQQRAGRAGLGCLPPSTCHASVRFCPSFRGLHECVKTLGLLLSGNLGTLRKCPLQMRR